ncbi:EVE domain-containing protein [Paracoccus sp. p1-h21]|uniref:EVE domain-containing protein n=1 Tax=Paracoccus sp. p1-h21 TaxID=3366951 RepID=UPI0037A42172
MSQPRPPASGPTRFWIGVVSRAHVLRGVAGGFAMLNHGKLAPLRRMSPGDWLVYYSPKTAYPDGDVLQAFTAIGQIADADPFQAEMRPGMMGFRRDVAFLDATETPISALRDRLEFTRSPWGMLARRGMFEISAADFQTIRDAMLKG